MKNNLFDPPVTRLLFKLSAIALALVSLGCVAHWVSSGDLWSGLAGGASAGVLLRWNKARMEYEWERSLIEWERKEK